MSLIVFAVWKLFFKNKAKEEIPRGVFIAANILTALLSAAGHYEWRECYRFQPSIAAYLSDMRSPTKRHLKYPKREKPNNCKVIFNREHCE